MEIAAILIIGVGAYILFASPQDTTGEDVQLPDSYNPGDRTTWPQGDKIWTLAQAIANAEGYGQNPSNGPTRNNNPGDISDYAMTYGYDGAISDSQVTRFPDPATGWHALYGKLAYMFAGKSSVYSPDASFTEFATHWAGNASVWLQNVLADLRLQTGAEVFAGTTLRDWYNS